jgi:hypothetical protein
MRPIYPLDQPTLRLWPTNVMRAQLHAAIRNPVSNQSIDHLGIGANEPNPTNRLACFAIDEKPMSRAGRILRRGASSGLDPARTWAGKNAEWLISPNETLGRFEASGFSSSGWGSPSRKRGSSYEVSVGGEATNSVSNRLDAIFGHCARGASSHGNTGPRNRTNQDRRAAARRLALRGRRTRRRGC